MSENNSSKTTAASLLADLKQRKEDAAALTAYWTETLGIPVPSQQEMMLMVRTCGLDYLVLGIDAYAENMSKKNQAVADGKLKSKDLNITTVAAKNYVCATARNIMEKDDPQDRPQTERRRRRSMVLDPKNPDAFNADNWHEATPEERQKAMAATMTEEQKGKVQ